MYTENLDGYKRLKNTDSCYLDGRYFNKVFIRYPGLLTNPLNIVFRETRIKTASSKRDEMKYYIHMKESNFNEEYPGLLRLVIETPKSKHSNLLIDRKSVV